MAIKKGDKCLLPYLCYNEAEMKKYGETKHLSDTHFSFIPHEDMAIKMLDSLTIGAKSLGSTKKDKGED